MRDNWELTQLETALFITSVTLMVGGFLWATGIG